MCTIKHKEMYETTGGFKRYERIKSSSDIQKLFKAGRKVSTNGAKLFVCTNGTDKTRIGFALPRGYGNAVKRNTAKRFGRESFRLVKRYLKNGYDLLLLVYPAQKGVKGVQKNISNNSFQFHYHHFCLLCEKADLIEAPKPV